MKNTRITHVDIFSLRVEDYLNFRSASREPPVLYPHSPCSEVVAVLRDKSDAKNWDCALIADKDSGRLVGIITEADVVRRIAFLAEPHTPVSEVMTHPVLAVEDRDYLYTAIGVMEKSGLRHMPVVDSEGKAVALLRLGEAMRFGAQALFRRLRWMQADGHDLEAFRAVKHKQVDLAAELMDEYVPVPHIQAVISQINRELNRSVIEKALEEMKTPCPCAFAVLMMGSGGREENFLTPDQDNGIIIDDYADSDHNRIDTWFREFSEKLNIYLDDVGFPLCTGHVMARNPMWRKTLSEWRRQTEIWIVRKLPFAISYADIFFDFTHLYGERDLVSALRAHVMPLLVDNPAFVRMLFYDETHKAELPLGMFDRIKPISRFSRSAHVGEINMKHNVIMPLVQSLRHLSLRFGITETASHKRLIALHNKGFFNADSVTDITDAFQVTTRILLGSQIAQHKAGASPSNFVKVKSLSARQKSDLRRSLRTIREVKRKTMMEFGGQVL